MKKKEIENLQKKFNLSRNRKRFFSFVVPTLTNPFYVIKDIDNSNVFVKAFKSSDDEIFIAVLKQSPTLKITTLSKKDKNNIEKLIERGQIVSPVKKTGLGSPTPKGNKSKNSNQVLSQFTTIELNLPFDNCKDTKTNQLNGLRHKGIAKTALSECGRLKKGFKFDGNGAIKKVKKQSKQQAKEDKMLIVKQPPVADLTDAQIKQIGKEYASDILWNKNVVDYVELVLVEKKRRDNETETVYVKFLNKDNNFKEEKKCFNSYKEAEKWCRKEFEKFNPDMISYGDCKVKKTKTISDIKDILPRSKASRESIAYVLEKGFDYYKKVTQEQAEILIEAISSNPKGKPNVNTTFLWQDFSREDGAHFGIDRSDKYSTNLFSKPVGLVSDFGLSTFGKNLMRDIIKTINPTPPKKPKAKVVKKTSPKSKKAVSKKPKVDTESGQLALFGLNGIAENIEKHNQNFNADLNLYKDNLHQKTFFKLGETSNILVDAGLIKTPIILQKRVLKAKIEKHGIKYSEIENLPKLIADPLFIFSSKHKDRQDSFIVVTKNTTREGLLSVVLSYDSKLMGYNIQKVNSIGGRSYKQIYSHLNLNLLRYANKKNVNTFITRSTIGAQSQYLRSVANIRNFFNFDTKKSDPPKKGLNSVIDFENKSRVSKKYDNTAMATLREMYGLTRNYIRQSINGVYTSANALKIKSEYERIAAENTTVIDPVIVTPQAQKIVAPVNVIPTEWPTEKTERKTSLVTGINHIEESRGNFEIGGDIGKFLGNIEIKPVGSVACTVDAPQGAGKTRFFFQIMNELAKNYKVLFISLEEHPQSSLFKDKVKQYIEPQNIKNIDTVGELAKGKEKQILDSLIPNYNVVLVDSWNKIFEASKLDFDNDLRKAYNGKLIFAIFQRTVSGSMRGGAKAQFDGDIIMKVDKGDDFKNNIVYHDKNRYHNADLTQLHYNIYNQKLVAHTPEEETPEPLPENQPIVDEIKDIWEDATVYI